MDESNKKGPPLPSKEVGTMLPERLANFLLAGRALGRSSVVNLLLSSSFGINAVFYAAWLGFTIGAWALVIQAAWALSFILLIPHSEKFRTVNSLHDFVGRRFGSATKILAACCSLVGIMYLIGWEVGIGKVTITSVLTSSDRMVPAEAASMSEILILGVVAVTLFYTILGGLRGNAVADTLLNLLKILIVGALVIPSIYKLYLLDSASLFSAMFPSFATMREKLGIWGLVTNVLFNLSWQFVDNSSWQSIIAGSANPEDRTRRNLLSSSLVIFMTIGVLGTLLGVSLVNSPNVTPENILTMSILALPQYEPLLSIGMVILIIACVMSLVDGMFLAAALIIGVDILPTYRISADLSSNTKLFIAKVALVLVAILSVWGIDLIFRISGANLFDFVYIVILTQLAIIGPVVVGLAMRSAAKTPMWVAIIFGLIVGFGSVIIGKTAEMPYLVDGAGTFTIVASLASAYLLLKWKAREP